MTMVLLYTGCKRSFHFVIDFQLDSATPESHFNLCRLPTECWTALPEKPTTSASSLSLIVFTTKKQPTLIFAAKSNQTL